MRLLRVRPHHARGGSTRRGPGAGAPVQLRHTAAGVCLPGWRRGKLHSSSAPLLSSNRRTCAQQGGGEVLEVGGAVLRGKPGPVTLTVADGSGAGGGSKLTPASLELHLAAGPMKVSTGRPAPPGMPAARRALQAGAGVTLRLVHDSCRRNTCVACAERAPLGALGVSQLPVMVAPRGATCMHVHTTTRMLLPRVHTGCPLSMIQCV